MWQMIKQIVRAGVASEPLPACDNANREGTGRIQDDVLAILGRALTIREVDAGSCNGCDLEIHALNNPYYNIEGAGIKFVASPRHADMLLVTGPVSKHMEVALRRTYEATPEPRLVVAVGDCGCSGGLFGESYASCGRVANVLPVDVAVPGCPPPPIDILRGILTAVRKCRQGTGQAGESQWHPDAPPRPAPRTTTP
ncbi:MAG: formate hydrogenlyase [Candidatus Methylophosphatis roskildensis]